MPLIYHLTILFVGISAVKSQLPYTDPSRDDGPCRYPAPVPLLQANFLLNPFKGYYIPVASENFYRFEYEMVLNETAQTEDDISSLQPIAEVAKAELIEHLSLVNVYFFGNRSIHYSYRVFPTLFPISLNPLFNVTAYTVHGSSGSADSNFGGPIIFTVIWNDNSPAWNLYTCIGRRQMFHILSVAPSLTEDQLKINKELLIGMGFNTTNFHYMNYEK